MPSDDELREQLRKQADEIIEAILAGRKPAGQNNLQELERLIIGAGQEFEERMLKSLAQEESQAPSEPICEKCGVRMRSQGKRKRHLVSEAGEIELERRYYVCPACGKRSFPPG